MISVMTSSAARRLGAVVVSLALASGACAGSGSSTAPTGAASAEPTGLPTATAIAVPTATPRPLEALTLAWQKGGPTQKQASTYWPAIDPITGNVWVSSPFDDAFWIFSPDGKYLQSWGSSGSGDGQFSFATHDPKPDGIGAIAFAPDGSFYVADGGNYRIEKFDKDRHFVLKWGSFGTDDGQFGQPKGIATDGKVVYVADDPRGDIQVFDTDGHFIRKFAFSFVLFSLGPDGYLYRGSGGSGGMADTIDKYDVQGNQLAEFTVPADVVGGGGIGQVAVSTSGAIFAPIGDRLDVNAPYVLVELDANGTVLHAWSAGGETSALAPGGKAIYFARTSGGRYPGWTYIKKFILP